MFKTNSEKVFLVVMVIMSIVLFASLSGCALLDKLRGGVSPHTDYLIEVPNTLEVETPTASEDVRG